MIDRLRVLVAGSVAAAPGQAGAAWAVLQYVLGLRALGHDVHLIEPLPASAPQPGAPLAACVNAAYFQQVVGSFGLAERATLLDPETGDTVGASLGTLRAFARGADLLLNVAGMLTDPILLGSVRRRVYLDLDPAFVQLWQTVEGIDMGLAAHSRFVTVGLNVGQPDCPVPTAGRDWIPTLPPVVLDCWQPGRAVTLDAFTTVGNWRSYGSIHHQGVHYGQRVHAFRDLLPLPQRSGQRFVLALAIHRDERADLAALAAHGWRLVDPLEVAATPSSYRGFIAGSRAELCVPKSGYTVSRSGWFSDRSACYLASARPVVALDTGFGRALPTGEGLFAVTGVEGAAAAVEEVAGDHARHAKAARDLAETYLDARLVLSTLLERVGGGA